MEESKSLWSKTAAELTVKDQLVVSAIFMAIPVVMIGGFGVAVTLKEKLQEKRQARRSNKNTFEVVE